MQTKEDVRLGFIPAIVDEYEADNVQHGRPYKDRILAAGLIVTKGGVERIQQGEYRVQSSGTGTVKYTVNGHCSCPDGKPDEKGESKAPHGWCKHRMAVRIHVKVEAKLKELVDLRVPHAHTWDCAEHRDLPIECWTRACGNPTKIPCHTCANHVPTDETEPPFTTIDLTTGEIVTETPFTDEEIPMMTSIGETIKSVVTSLNGHTNGTHTPDLPPDLPHDLPPILPLTTEQYEPAPVLTPRVTPLPEAAASLNIQIRMEQFQLMYTMRAHTDNDVLERLPNVLATMERLMKIEVDHDEPFLKRLLHAFFPKPSRYTGK